MSILTLLQAHANQLYTGAIDDSWAHVCAVLKDAPRFLRLIPDGPFETDARPDAPDYCTLEAWSAHPDRQAGRAIEDANLISVEGETPPPPADERPACCFFVHDTCYNPPEAHSHLLHSNARPSWNAPVCGGEEGGAVQLLAEKVNEMVDLRVAMGGSPFNRTCRVYAPRYRQANVLALLALQKPPWPLPDHSQSANQAVLLAYGDVLRAFRQFLAEIGPDTPFLLASHSQGSCHLGRLVREEIVPSEGLAQRLVCGYLAGFAVPLSTLGDASRVRPSRGPESINAIASWMTISDKHVAFMTKGARSFSKDGSAPVGKDEPLLGTNPVTWHSANKMEPAEEATPAGSNFPADSDSTTDLDSLSNPLVVVTRSDVDSLSDRAPPSGWLQSSPAEHLGATLPHTGIDVTAPPRSIVTNLRYTGLQDGHAGAIGLRVSELRRVPAGELSTRLTKGCCVQVPPLTEPPLRYAERDALLYHDLDFALFHFNVRENAAVRVRKWMEVHRHASKL
jgi:hypothetical protein